MSFTNGNQRGVCGHLPGIECDNCRTTTWINPLTPFISPAKDCIPRDDRYFDPKQIKDAFDELNELIKQHTNKENNIMTIKKVENGIIIEYTNRTHVISLDMIPKEQHAEYVGKKVIEILEANKVEKK